jgi:hypothetical protein
MISKDERRARAIRAKIFTDSDEVKQAFIDIEAEITGDWAKAWLPRKREALWLELNAVRKLREKLTVYAGQAPRE